MYVFHVCTLLIYILLYTYSKYYITVLLALTITTTMSMTDAKSSNGNGQVQGRLLTIVTVANQFDEFYEYYYLGI